MASVGRHDVYFLHNAHVHDLNGPLHGHQGPAEGSQPVTTYRRRQDNCRLAVIVGYRLASHIPRSLPTGRDPWPGSPVCHLQHPVPRLRIIGCILSATPRHACYLFFDDPDAQRARQTTGKTREGGHASVVVKETRPEDTTSGSCRSFDDDAKCDIKRRNDDSRRQRVT